MSSFGCSLWIVEIEEVGSCLCVVIAGVGWGVCGLAGRRKYLDLF